MSTQDEIHHYAAERIITKAIVEARALSIPDEIIAEAVIKIAMEEGLAGHPGRKPFSNAA